MCLDILSRLVIALWSGQYKIHNRINGRIRESFCFGHSLASISDNGMASFLLAIIFCRRFPVNIYSLL